MCQALCWALEIKWTMRPTFLEFAFTGNGQAQWVRDPHFDIKGTEGNTVDYYLL